MSLYLPFCRGLIHGYILKCLIIGELLFSNILFTDFFSFSPFSLFSRCGYYHGGGCVSHRGVINAPKEYCPSAFMRWLKVAVWAMEVDFRSSWRVFPPPSLWVHGGFWRWLCEPWSVIATYIWVVSPPPSLWVYGGLLVHGGSWRWLCEPWSVIATYIWVVSPLPSLWVHGAYWFMGAFDMKVAMWAMECDCYLYMSGVPPTFLVIYWSYIFSLFLFFFLSMDTFSSLVWIDR